MVGKKIKVLSLFSGCGGMDLGFEGGFEVLATSYNKSVHPDWNVKKSMRSGWIMLGKTPFTTVFANDIRKDAKSAWVNYFSKRGHKQNTYYVESIVDLVKKRKITKIFFPKGLIL